MCVNVCVWVNYVLAVRPFIFLFTDFRKQICRYYSLPKRYMRLYPLKVLPNWRIFPEEIILSLANLVEIPIMQLSRACNFIKCACDEKNTPETEAVKKEDFKVY